MAGVLSLSEYRDALAAAGFTTISSTLTQQAADGLHPALVRATRP